MSKIYSVKGDLFEGTIKTDVGEISWKYDREGQCCENYGVDVSNNDFSWLEGKKMINFDLQESFKDLQYGDSDNHAILKLQLENNEVWTIDFSNCHNGYYSHNLDIFVDGQIKWNLAL